MKADWNHLYPHRALILHSWIGAFLWVNCPGLAISCIRFLADEAIKRGNMDFQLFVIFMEEKPVYYQYYFKREDREFGDIQYPVKEMF